MSIRKPINKDPAISSGVFAEIGLLMWLLAVKVFNVWGVPRLIEALVI
jgi:hypothetical protein